MLASHSAPSGRVRRQGCSRASLAELRRELASPSELPENCRQRLETLAKRLRRVQGRRDGEYIRVQLSEHAKTAMDCGALTA